MMFSHTLWPIFFCHFLKGVFFSFSCHFQMNKDRKLHRVSNESLFSIDHGAHIVFKDSLRFRWVMRVYVWCSTYWQNSIGHFIAIFENGLFFSFGCHSQTGRARMLYKISYESLCFVDYEAHIDSNLLVAI